MSEYVFRYASGYGCDMSALMDGGRVTVGEYFASDATDHYGTLHEEIVRCRDCRAMRVKYGNTGIECWMNGEPFTVEPDGFCKWGERKEGE